MRPVHGGAPDADALMDFGSFEFTPDAIASLLIGIWAVGLGAGAIASVLAAMRRQ